MAKALHERVAKALNRWDIRPDIRREVANAIMNSASWQVERERWVRILNPLKHHLRSARTNLTHHPVQIRPLVGTYIDVLNRTYAIIVQRSETIDDAGQRRPVSYFTKEAVRLNAERAAAGRPNLGVRNTHWQSWVPPDVVRSVRAEFERAYAELGRVQGKRVLPFAPQAERLADRERIKALRRQFRDVRLEHNHPRAFDLIGALHLAAVRMAERALNDYAAFGSNDYQWDTPRPITWTGYLTPEMRERLSQGRDSPTGIATDGLLGFMQERV